MARPAGAEIGQTQERWVRFSGSFTKSKRRRKDMLPSTLRYWLFDTLSVQTMRYVSAVPTRQARGLTRRVYEMIREDFFKNGSLTSRSRVPELMAAIWTLGRESMLVEDRVDRTTKDAISAVLSQINECLYCEDMLISLVHAAGEHEAAGDIFERSSFDESSDLLRTRLEWVRAVATPGENDIPETPFSEEQLPEIIGTLMGMTDINRFSHVVMETSPVGAPFGLRSIKAWALRAFGIELKVTRARPLAPGRALDLLPPAELPDDMRWAEPNPRIATAVSQWAATVEREGAKVVPAETREVVLKALSRWNGEVKPLDGRWIDADIESLGGRDKSIARLAIVLAKAPYRVTEKMVNDVIGEARDEERFVRILAWSSFVSARRFAQLVAQRVAENPGVVERTDTAA
jgi:AhpD family alkylhydroperoxidase